jgi:metal-sulfur cluster biosynthetic enzyme
LSHPFDFLTGRAGDKVIRKITLSPCHLVFFEKENPMETLPTAEAVRELLKSKVRDPELMMNIVDLGLIYGVEITENKTAEITMTLTSPGCPAGPQIITDVQRETHEAYPELEEVNVHLTWSPFWNPDMMSEEAREELGIY